MIKKNVSSWIHIFLGLSHWFFQRDIMTISLMKISEWITWLDIKSPSCNTFLQCLRVIIRQNNGTLVKKQKHILQISVQELHHYMILPISQIGFFSARTVHGKICIGDTSLRKYMPQYIQPMNKINKITHV